MRFLWIACIGLASAVSAASPSPSARPASTPPAAMTPAQIRGQAVFRDNCASCHGPGIGNPGLKQKPGTAALQAKYKGAIPALLEQRTDLSPEVVEFFVRNGVSVMPMFRKTEVGNEQMKDLSAYLTRLNT